MSLYNFLKLGLAHIKVEGYFNHIAVAIRSNAKKRVWNYLENMTKTQNTCSYKIKWKSHKKRSIYFTWEYFFHNIPFI